MFSLETWTENHFSSLQHKMLNAILFAFTVSILWIFEKKMKNKMASIKNKTLGELRLLFIHSRVEYLFLNDLDDDNMDEFKYKPLCDYCEMKLDMSGGKKR